MKFTRIAAIAGGAALVAVVAVSVADTEPETKAKPPQPQQTTTPESEATYKDIEQTLGFVPSFFRAFPDHGLAGAWAEMKGMELNPKTAVPPRTKELIGLAVAAQIPCRYCVYFHTNVAKANGATDEQVKEAIAIAAQTRHWATWLSGMQTDLAKFKDEVPRMFAGMEQRQKQGQAPPPPPTEPIVVTDQASAFKDMQQTMGMVPTFMRQLPEEAVAGAWLEMKELYLAPTTALDAKSKDLISLGVSSQVPCPECVFFDTYAAHRDGATDEEIRETVAMAAVTRHWSTVLNGSQVDEATFHRDVDRIVKDATNKSAKK